MSERDPTEVRLATIIAKVLFFFPALAIMMIVITPVTFTRTWFRS